MQEVNIHVRRKERKQMNRYSHTAVCKCGWTYGAHSYSDDSCPKENKDGSIKTGEFYKNRQFELAKKGKKKIEKV